MKRIVSFILAIFLAGSTFTACTRSEEIDNKIKEHASELADDLTYYGAEPEEEYYGNFSQEKYYAPPQERDWEGIVSPDEYPSRFRIYNDRLYYKVYKPIPSEPNQSYSIEAVMDLTTGEQSYLCNDPVCTHEYGYDCRAVSIQPSHYWNEKFVEIHAINRADYLIDIEISLTDIHSGTRKNLAYFSADYSGEEAFLSYGSTFIHKNMLYFNICRSYTDPGTKTQIKTIDNFAYDLTNNILRDPIPTPERYQTSSPFYYDGEYYYWFVPYYALLLTDENFENEKILCDFGGVTPNQSNWFYDIETKEMLYLLGNKKTQTGTLYRIKNGEAEPLSLPHEDICYFYLTRDKIYYSTYKHAYAIGTNPTGQSELGDTVYENGGGIVYVTDRETREEAEVFFDNGQVIDLYMHDGWIVLDGNLYMLSMSYRIADTVSFARRPYQKVMRINPANNTLRYFRFD